MNVHNNLHSFSFYLIPRSLFCSFFATHKNYLSYCLVVMSFHQHTTWMGNSCFLSWGGVGGGGSFIKITIKNHLHLR